MHWFLSDCRVMASMSVDMIVLSPVTIVPEWLVIPAGCEVLQAWRSLIRSWRDLNRSRTISEIAFSCMAGLRKSWPGALGSRGPLGSDPAKPDPAKPHRPPARPPTCRSTSEDGTTGAFHLAFLSSTTFTSSQKPGDTSLGCCDTTRLRQSSRFSRKATASADAAMTGD